MGPGARTHGPSAARNIDRFFEYSVLGMLASGFFAVLGSGFLDMVSAVVMTAALVARVLMLSGLIPIYTSPRLVAALTLAYIGFYPVDYVFLSREFVPATVHLVFFLAVTKLLTASSERDYNLVKVVAFLELLAASIVSGSLNFFVFLGLFILLAVATFTSGEIRRSSRKQVRVVRAGLRSVQWRIAGLTVVTAIGILALTAGMFFILPRTARAAFQRLAPEQFRLPGFSNEVELGEIGEIKNNKVPVMRVRRVDAQSGPGSPYFAELGANLKWRGNALSRFDGRRWSSPASLTEEPRRTTPFIQVIAEDERPPSTVSRLNYEVHMQDTSLNVLFFAGVPEFLQINTPPKPTVTRSPGGSYRVPLTLLQPLSYIAYAYLPPPEGQISWRPLDPAERVEYLQLPRMDPRVTALAAEWTAGARTPARQAEAVEQHLRRDFRYSLQLPKTPQADPIADFLFRRRQGHCEYFASAMAVMLRSVGIPSRVVTGFQSGEFNPVSGWLVIRASDAHSWVEAWLPQRGWTVFDPTPPDPNAGVVTAWTKLGYYLDATETFWQEWILNYNLDRQIQFALKMQSSTRSGINWMDGFALSVEEARRTATAFFRHWGASLALVLIMLALGIYLGPRIRVTWNTRRRVLRVQRGEAQASDATLLYNRMLDLLSRKGIEKPAWLTPVEFARGLPPSSLTPLVEDLTAAYNDLRFGSQREAAGRMVVLLEQLEQA
jgi:transglutaminase-like putative cysteine protease